MFFFFFSLRTGAAKRVAKDGQVYYDWEMVASPPAKECPSAVGCLYPAHIYLMSVRVDACPCIFFSVSRSSLVFKSVVSLFT